MVKTSEADIIVTLQSKGFGAHNSALESIYRDHYPVIKSFILKNNGSEIEAQDIFQDAIIVFYEKMRLSDFVLTSSIRTFIYSVSRNLWLNRLKVQSRSIELNDEIEMISIEPNIVNALESNELNDLIFGEISKIGADCKKVLIHYYYDRMRMKKIAELMSFANEQVAKNRKSSCMKKLKVLIKANRPLLDMLNKN